MKKITQILKNGHRRLFLGGVLALGSGVASAVDMTPPEVVNLFTNLGDTAYALFLLAVILFAVIRGGMAVIKISSKFFGAAGA